MPSSDKLASHTHKTARAARTAETDPNGKKPHEPGAKLDANKPPVVRGTIQYFPRAITAVSAVSAFGASKYAWDSWVAVPDGFQRYTDALGRHLIAEACGELIDPDSGILHAAHVAWNALARLELLMRQIENKSEAADRG
jgi:hypothetical protein